VRLGGDRREHRRDEHEDHQQETACEGQGNQGDDAAPRPQMCDRASGPTVAPQEQVHDVVRRSRVTPSVPDTTRTAASSTASARSTSATKSEWPGVSTRLTGRPSTTKDATALRIVMPRRRSSAMVSVTVVPASTLPGSAITPAS